MSNNKLVATRTHFVKNCYEAASSILANPVKSDKLLKMNQRINKILCLTFSCQWDLETGRKTNDVVAHNGDVVSISLSLDGNSFITGSVDQTCKLWDVRDMKPKQTFFGHTADVNSVCVSIPIGNQLGHINYPNGL